MWGSTITSGDFNNDGFKEIISLDVNGNVVGKPKYKRYMYSTNPFDSLPEIVREDSCGGPNGPWLCAGDWNGDGIDDLAIVTYPDNDNIGRTLICYGSSSFDMVATDTIVAPAWGIGYGDINAITTGDLNGDGIDDLAVGAYWGNSVYIHYGDTSGIHINPDVVLHGQVPSECFGISIGSGGDMNGDGYDDLVVGADYNSEVYGAGGKVYVFKGGNPIDTLPYVGMYGENAGAQLGGFGTAIIPNIKTNTYATGFLGTPFSPKTPPSTGKQYWLYGGSTFDGSYDLLVSGYYYDSGLGQTCAYAGDIDSNMLGDYISGTIQECGDRGAAYIWVGRSSMTGACDAAIVGVDSSLINGRLMSIGSNVTTVGDVNKDGKDEFVVSNYCGDTLFAIWICKYTGPVGVTGEPVNNEQLTLHDMLQNSPNPFSQSTIIKYQLSQSGQVGLKIYNIQGQMVKTLVNEDKKAGSYETRWDGRDDIGQKVTNGIYIYSLQTGKDHVVKRMTLLK